MEIALPLDDEGYLRRKCYDCRRQYKVVDTPGEDAPDDFEVPDAYRCPYCGQAAPHDDRLTRPQIDYIQLVARGEVPDDVDDVDLESLLAEHDLTTAPSEEFEELPPSIQERDDMVGATAPCHPFLGFQVIGLWQLKLHCMLCGEKFGDDPPEVDTSIPF